MPPQCWKTAWYDTIAETYDRLAVPHVFSRPARDLVAMLKLPPGARVLDVGSGTGIAAAVASESAGLAGQVVALDASFGMLALARKKGLNRLVLGIVPELPFGDAVFDGVLANFVLSHIPSYQRSLLDMCRVLRPGGRLAFSAWGPSQSESRKLWQRVAESFVSKDQLSRGLRDALPGEEWFSDGGHLERALGDAGLSGIEVHHREYPTRISTHEFLLMRETTVQARLMREMLDRTQWESFRRQVRDEFRRRPGDLVEDTRDAFLAVGTKRAH